MDLFPVLLAPDNVARGQAERQFEQMKKQPDACLSVMMEALTTSPRPDIRSLIAVLLRTSVFGKVDNLWPRLSGGLQTRVKAALLQVLMQEKVNHVRHKMVDTTAELAGVIFQASPQASARDWPELMSFMFQAAGSPQEEHRESSLRMFTRLSNFVFDVMSPDQGRAVKQIFAKCMHEENLTVRMAAMSAIITYIETGVDDATKREFQKLTAKMAELVQMALAQDKEEEARTAIGMFVELADSDPLFYRPVIGNVCELMAKIITSQGLEDATRQVALEYLVTMCEVKPGMMRKVPNFVPSLVNMCVAMLLEVEDDKEWFTRSTEAVDVTNSDVASQAMDRLCLAMTGRIMIPILQKVLPPLLKSPNWKQRHAALVTMCIMGEGCNEQVADDLPSFVAMLVPFFQDEHPRVRFSAFNCLGQMCTDFGTALQEDHHADLMPRLLTQLESEQVPKVQAHTCACIVNWCDNLDPLELKPYINRMMAGIANVIKGGSIVAQEQALVALSAVAECTGEMFTPFYSVFMPICKTVMMRATGKKFRELQGRAIDAITIMASAVGPATFHADAADVLPVLVSLQKSNMASDDPMVKHLMQGWARLCRCLKAHFVPYLNVVMPSLLKAASQMPETIRLTQENYDMLEEEGTWQFREVLGESFAVKTISAEEKALAVNMLFCFAHDLEEHFMPYVSESAKIVVPLLNFYLDSSVRQAVCSAVPQLLNCIVKHVKNSNGNPGMVGEFWNAVLPVILESLDAEPEVETSVSKVECFRDCLLALGPGCLTQNQLQLGLSAFMTTTMACLKRKYGLSVREEEEDFDELERDLLDQEQHINEVMLATLADLHCEMIKSNPQGYMELLTKLQVENQVLLSMIISMAERPITNTDMQIAICMMDDIIEFGGPGSDQLYGRFVPCLMKNMDHPDGTIRQAAVYGIGVFFQVAAPQATQPQIINSMIKKLHVVITAKNSRKKANVMATENAISAFAKALEFKAAVLEDEKSAVEAFVNYLPVSKDRAEAKITYDRFLRFVASNRKFIFGDNFRLLPKILNVLATILGSKLVKKQLNQKIMETLQMLQKQLPGPAMQQALSQLSPELQQKLQEWQQAASSP